MEIRFSRYNLPFRELPEQGVYYIPRDFQAAIASGRLDAHVHAYNSTTRQTLQQFLDSMYFDSGVRAAALVSGRSVKRIRK